MPSIILLGGGGHCASCIEVIEKVGDWEIIGIVYPAGIKGAGLWEYPCLGTDEELLVLIRQYKNALITVGQLKSSDIRRKLFIEAERMGAIMPSIISPTAVVSQRSAIGRGSIAMHRAYVGPRVEIGLNCILNTGCIVEHDSFIGDHCHVSTSAVVNGECVVGDGCFIGSGSVIRNGVRIAARTTVGAGAVVIKDIEDSGVYAGCPARRMG